MQVDCFPEAPADWPRCVVDDLAEVNPSYKLDRQAEYPFVEMAAVAENFGGITRFDRRALESSGLARFKKNDILFGKITPCAENGKVALVEDLPGEFGIGSTEFIVLSPRNGHDPRFVHALLCSNPVHGRAVSRMEGSTGRLRITEDVFMKWLRVSVPPPEEQAAIARLLAAADEAIERTREAIEKARRVKRGLMQTLLSCGIDENGQIRNPETQPEQFQSLPIGKIPCVWSVRRLEAMTEIGSGVTLGRNLEGVQTVELPYLRVANVQDGFLDLSEMKTVIVPLCEVTRYQLKKGDVVLTEGGDFDKLGRGAVWDGSIEPCLHQNHIFRVRPNSEELDSNFLSMLIGGEHGKRYFLRIAKRTTNLASINKTQLRAFPVLLPSLKEQQRIVSIVDAAQISVQAHEKSCSHLQTLKRGLMQDLLTGRVRVPVEQGEPGR